MVRVDIEPRVTGGGVVRFAQVDPVQEDETVSRQTRQNRRAVLGRERVREVRVRVGGLQAGIRGRVIDRVGFDADFGGRAGVRDGPRSVRAVIGGNVLRENLERILLADGQAAQRDGDRGVRGLLENEIVRDRVAAGVVAVPVLRGVALAKFIVL